MSGHVMRRAWTRRRFAGGGLLAAMFGDGALSSVRAQITTTAYAIEGS